MSTPPSGLLPPFPFAGEAASLAAAMIWAGTMSIFARFGREVGADALNLYKNFVAVTCLLAVAVVIGEPPPAAPWAYGLLALSGIVGLAIGDTALFVALRRLGAQRTTAIQCLAPPIAGVIAFFAVGEELSAHEVAGMALTVFAVLGTVLARRRPTSVQAALTAAAKATAGAGIAAAVFAAFCQGAGVVLSRQAFAEVHVVHGTVMRIVPALLILTLMTQWSAAHRTPTSSTAARRRFSNPFAAGREIWADKKRGAWITIGAFFGTFVGLLLMSFGVKYAKAGVATALSSTYPVWIIPVARFILKEEGTWLSAAFTVLAAVGVAVMLLG